MRGQLVGITLVPGPAASPLVATQGFPHGGHEMEVLLQLARVGGSLAGQVDVDHGADPARPRRHDDDAGRKEHGLRDRVRDEHDRRLGALPDLEQLEIHPLTGHLVEGPERLVHQQDRGVDRECAGDGDALLHPARQLPRVVPAEVGQLDETEMLERSFSPLALRRAAHLEGQLDVALHSPPVEQDGRLEHHAVVAIESRPRRWLPVDRHAARCRRREVADDP